MNEKCVKAGGENTAYDLYREVRTTYRVDPESRFGVDNEFIKRVQLYDIWLWRRFEEMFATPGVDDFRNKKDPFGWRGEYWGKMMRGAALICTWDRDETLYEILTDSVKRMLGNADALGRISTYSVENEFNGWDLWCRKYIMLGFQYYLEICRDEALAQEIIRVMCRHADYIMEKIGPEAEGKKPITKATAHWKGLNSSSILEPYVRLYNITGEKKYLDFAEYIISEGGCEDGNIFEMAYRDEIAPYEYPVTKAYEMMSCFEGLLEYYRATVNEKYRDAAIRFGYRILHTDVTVLGCCGCTNELFDNSTRMQTKISENGILQETCVTVTWMKMCFQLFRLTGDPVFTDAIEQSFCNAYLGSLNTHMTVKPERNSAMGVIAYMLMPFDSYSPLTAGVRGRRVGGRKFFDKYTYYGCCACIGDAGIGVLGKYCMMEYDGGLAVNYYIPGTADLTLAGGEFAIRCVTGYPYDGRVELTILSCPETALELKLRIPQWSAGTRLTLCGEEHTASGGYFATGSRVWHSGDTIVLEFDMRVRAVYPPCADGPDSDRYIAFAKGPVMLAKDVRITDNLAQTMDAVVDADGCVEFSEVTPPPAVHDARVCGEITRTDGEKVLLIDYSSAGKTLSNLSECAVWLLK